MKFDINRTRDGKVSFNPSLNPNDHTFMQIYIKAVQEKIFDSESGSDESPRLFHCKHCDHEGFRSRQKLGGHVTKSHRGQGSNHMQRLKISKTRTNEKAIHRLAKVILSEMKLERLDGLMLDTFKLKGWDMAQVRREE